MHCASCGTLYPDNAVFCPGCGQRITQRRPMPVAAPVHSNSTPISTPVGAAAGAGGMTAAPQASGPSIPREELRAAVAARAELGERMEQEVIDSFLQRIERTIDARVDARLTRGGHIPAPRARGDSDLMKNTTGRIAASLGIGIPLTAIAGGIAGVIGILAVWAAIVVLNIYYTEVDKQMQMRRRD